MLESNSAVVHFAFMDRDRRDRWIAQGTDIDSAKLDAFRARAERARTRGYERAKSSFTVGITDLAAPILRGNSPAAVLTVPFVQSIGEQMRIEPVLDHLRAAAAEFSEQLVASDHRV